MVINNSTIFYFSGTGNSLNVAKDIKSGIQNSELISIPKIIDEDKIEFNGEYLGIVCPVYMWGLPLIVDKFIKKLNISKDTYVFAAVTMGGSFGNSLKQVNDILEIKGSKLRAGFAIVMPDNYIAMYEVKSEEKQKKDFVKEKIKVEEIIKVIKEKKDLEYPRSNILVEKAFVPLIYKMIYKLNTKDKKFWVKNNCTSCGICEKVCGVNNIELKDGKPMWKNKCEQCMACIQYCPQEAIQIGKWSEKRRRYRNPNVSLKEMMDGYGNK